LLHEQFTRSVICSHCFYVALLLGTLWRYCRASMSLAGFVPPIFDLTDEHLLLDGGYVNNLPADVMRSLGVRTVIAVDVGALTETEFTNYGDYLSGWWALWKKYNPWASPVRVMSMAEIQSRLAYVSCVRQLEEVKKAPYCHYVRPPIDKYQTFDFNLFDEIFNVGYWHGKTLLEEWKSSGKLHELFDGRSANLSKFAQREKFKRGFAFTSAQSFTDLAAMVSKIHRPFETSLDEISEEEGDDRIPLDLIHTTSSSSVKLA
ncbi:Patatin-like phospholipase domain-containing protein 7, partial [Trichinella sp. T6]